VWRIGFKPEPWAWAGWEWATGGRFHGRWDDATGLFRTVYAGSTLQACLLEVLACFRPDGTMLQALDDIAEDEEDAALHPTATAGHVPYSWLEPRTAAAAHLTGSFCAVTTAASIAALRPTFISQALRLGLGDFDASALKDGRPRILTQSVATHLYATTDVDGVTFTSRHGDDLELWAIFERPGDPPTSPRLVDLETHPLSPENPDLLAVFELFGLRWEPLP
jgi:hypothetical protein